MKWKIKALIVVGIVAILSIITYTDTMEKTNVFGFRNEFLSLRQGMGGEQSNSYIKEGNSVYWETAYGLVNVTPHHCTTTNCDINIKLKSKIIDDVYCNVTISTPTEFDNRRLERKENVTYNVNIYGNISVEEHKDCAGSYNENYGFISSSRGWCNDSICLDETNATNETSCYYEHSFDRYLTNESGVRFFWNVTLINEIIGLEERTKIAFVDRSSALNKVSKGVYQRDNVLFKPNIMQDYKIKFDVPFGISAKYNVTLICSDGSNTRTIKLDPWIDATTFTEELDDDEFYNYTQSEHTMIDTAILCEGRVCLREYFSTEFGGGDNGASFDEPYYLDAGAADVFTSEFFPDDRVNITVDNCAFTPSVFDGCIAGFNITGSKDWIIELSAHFNYSQQGCLGPTSDWCYTPWIMVSKTSDDVIAFEVIGTTQGGVRFIVFNVVGKDGGVWGGTSVDKNDSTRKYDDEWFMRINKTGTNFDWWIKSLPSKPTWELLGSGTRTNLNSGDIKVGFGGVHTSSHPGPVNVSLDYLVVVEGTSFNLSGSFVTNRLNSSETIKQITVVYHGNNTDNITGYAKTSGSSDWEQFSNNTPLDITDGNDLQLNWTFIAADSDTARYIFLENYTITATIGDVVYSLNISDPTTENPVSKNPSEILTIIYNFTKDEVDQTANVEAVNITIGDEECPFVQDELCTGTPDACSTFTTEDNCTFTNCTWTAGDLSMRTDDDGSTGANGLGTVTFTNMPSTNYAALATALTDNDVVYSLKVVAKNIADTDWWLEDDGGSNELANFMYAAMEHGHTTIEGNHVECGSEVAAASSFAVTFGTEFSDTNYAVVCNPLTDTDSPICILNDVTGKATTGFTLVLNDDGGTPETGTGVDWCAFEHGEYSNGNMVIKSGSEAVTDGAMTVTFSTNYADTEYVVFIMDATSHTDDGCICEVTARNVGSFTALCTDDGNSIANCDETFDWITLTIIDEDISGCSGTPKGCDNYTIVETCINNTGCGFANLTQETYIADVGWEVNCTIGAGCTGVEDLYLAANYTTDEIVMNDTQTNAIDCGGVEEDLCDPPPVGQWNQSVWCNITTPMQLSADLNCTDILNISSVLNFTSWDYEFRLGEGCERIVAPPDGIYGWNMTV